MRGKSGEDRQMDLKFELTSFVEEVEKTHDNVVHIEMHRLRHKNAEERKKSFASEAEDLLIQRILDRASKLGW